MEEEREREREKKKKGHLLATAVNVRAWYKVPLTLVGGTAGGSPEVWPCVDQPTEPSSFIFEQFAGKCHMERVARTCRRPVCWLPTRRANAVHEATALRT